ncbi:MAG: efflux RND transporter periplasmic adaptor subunit, partial [Planctomycetes bacterium]|nr:efflux RND transporter periplasmic adaptor subunit [Planctomycetota bacterium]
EVWTCSMHPNVQLPKAGLCPICNMALIPLEADDSETATGMSQLAVSENAMALMDIETTPVQRKFVTAVVRMSGKIEYDETNLSYITAWVPGRLDRLYLDYTGLPVREGDHMVLLYSPELIGAQEELLQAIQSQKNVSETDLGIMRDMARSTAQAAREKLRLWGLKPEQIAEIEKTGKVSDHVTIYAPTSGIVIHKNAVEGMYVQTGTKIYTIADLTDVWVKLDAYESDLEWLRYGQQVEFTTISYPGEVFKGTISFIDPILNEQTRTVKVRVNVPNPEGKLKPGMFAKAIVRARVAGAGRIMDADLVGKWICPMHPEIIKPDSGTCDTCQMPLVRTESLGYVSDDPELAKKPLVIPTSAALITGTRAIVYVRLTDTEKPTFEGRQIVLGPRAEDYYIVRSGLKEGELVVTRGNFKIDSSLQIMAKPSMMTPDVSDTHDHSARPRPAISDDFRDQLANLFTHYFVIQRSLADDKPADVADSADKALKALDGVSTEPLTGSDLSLWESSVKDLRKILADMKTDDDIKAIRENFYLLSQHLTKTAKRFGSTNSEPFYVFHCPMAFDNSGAEWLQDSDQTKNPYFGHMMLRCGSAPELIGPMNIWQEHGN